MTTTKLDKSIDAIAGECIAVRLRMLNRVVTKTFWKAVSAVRTDLLAVQHPPHLTRRGETVTLLGGC